MEGIIYFTKTEKEERGSRLHHMVGEKLLETGLMREYGKDLKYEPRGTGEHGKPFFTLSPDIHYNISHSGVYVMCAFAGIPVGLDVQKHEKKVNYELLLRRTVPQGMIREILDADNIEKAFYTQWVLREAFIKWTGEGLSRDMRTIPMDQGDYQLLDLEEGYSAAIWSGHPLIIRMEYVDITI